MGTDIVRQRLETTLPAKTLDDLVRVKTSESVYLLIDVSGSMDSPMKNAKLRIDGLREVVTEINSNRASAVPMIAFGGRDGGAYVTQGVPGPGGGTPLSQAIDLAKTKNAGRAIVISDGCPDSTTAALASAKVFGGRIDVVFVGDKGDYGEEFLKQLAAATGGTEFHGDLSEVKELGAKVIGLLGTGEEDDEETKGAILL